MKLDVYYRTQFCFKNFNMITILGVLTDLITSSLLSLKCLADPCRGTFSSWVETRSVSFSRLCIDCSYILNKCMRQNYWVVPNL